ncbi:MAG: hypothetical protein IK064_01720 [Clostridia bacterium]|nr:hypothetical protein [Clostridia bacterium]
MKGIISAFFAFIFCLSLVSCRATESALVHETALPSENTPTLETDDHALTFREVYDPETDYNSDLGSGMSTVLRTDDAYYYPGLIAAYLYYYDKVTGESGVLCPKPECLHDSERHNTGCAGNISAFDGQTVSYYKGKIYFDHETGFERVMYRMNPDGTGWERLFNIDCEEQYQPQRMAVHRGKIYGSNFTYIVRDAVSYETWNITCWDLETGEFKVIYEEDTGGRPKMEFFGDYVYFYNTYYNYAKNEDGTLITDKEGVPQIVDKTFKIFRYDTKTEQVEKILDVNRGSEIEGNAYNIRVAAEDRIYVAASGDGEKIYMLSEGELKEVFTVERKYQIRLLEDRVWAYYFFSKGGNESKNNMIMHSLIMDYNGNVIFEGDTDSFLDFNIEGFTEETWISYTEGQFYADNAYFVIYLYRFNRTPDPENSSRFSCLVKYEIINGKFEQTMIAVEKWC